MSLQFCDIQDIHTHTSFTPVFPKVEHTLHLRFEASKLLHSVVFFLVL